jgi:hypothetical protein
LTISAFSIYYVAMHQLLNRRNNDGDSGEFYD